MDGFERNSTLRPHKKHVVRLSTAERASLEELLARPNTPKRSLFLIRVLLLADQSPAGPAMIDREIAQHTHLSVRTIESIRAVYATQGLNAAIRLRRRT